MSEERDPVRIMIADDQTLFRGSIAALVDEQPDMEVVGEAENGLEAVERAHELQPDVVVMDVEMPVMGGIEATRLIKEQLPGVRIVMLTVSDTGEHVFEAIRAGADGYLLKNLRPDQLYDLLRSVCRNEAPVSPAVASQMLDELRSSSTTVRTAPSSDSDPPRLTRRELEVLKLVADGLSNKEIGTRLFISEGTVKNHVHNALEKLGLENRIQAAAYVVRQGLGSPRPRS